MCRQTLRSIVNSVSLSQWGHRHSPSSVLLGKAWALEESSKVWVFLSLSSVCLTLSLFSLSLSDTSSKYSSSDTTSYSFSQISPSSTAWATSCLNMNFMKYFTYCIICVIFPDLPPPRCSKLQHPIMELTKIWLTLEYETLQTSNDLMDPWQVITLLIFVFMIYFFCYKFFVWITFVCSWYFHFVAHDASTT